MQFKVLAGLSLIENCQTIGWELSACQRIYTRYFGKKRLQIVDPAKAPGGQIKQW